jgi:hypothetical protein
LARWLFFSIRHISPLISGARKPSSIKNVKATIKEADLEKLGAIAFGRFEEWQNTLRNIDTLLIKSDHNTLRQEKLELLKDVQNRTEAESTLKDWCLIMRNEIKEILLQTVAKMYFTPAPSSDTNHLPNELIEHEAHTAKELSLWEVPATIFAEVWNRPYQYKEVLIAYTEKTQRAPYDRHHSQALVFYNDYTRRLDAMQLWAKITLQSGFIVVCLLISIAGLSMLPNGLPWFSIWDVQRALIVAALLFVVFLCLYYFVVLDTMNFARTAVKTLKTLLDES